jgi:hypothetical protein
MTILTAVFKASPRRSLNINGVQSTHLCLSTLAYILSSSSFHKGPVLALPSASSVVSNFALQLFTPS